MIYIKCDSCWICEIEMVVKWLIRYECKYYIFFFKQKTAYEIVSRDWSSDVCSSDLRHEGMPAYGK